MITGITDLTTTEGNLRNFSRICKYVSNKVGRHQLIELIKRDHHINRKNKKVIERHLKILEKLNIINYQNSDYRLDDLGEVLYAIVAKVPNSQDYLTLEEKIFYFVTLFSGVTFGQLTLFLKNMDINKGKSKNEIMVEYFRSYLESPLKIWKRNSVEKCIGKYEKTGIFPRSFENKFDTMRLWLRSLELVKELELTNTGKLVLQKINFRDEFPANISLVYQSTIDNLYQIASLLLYKSAVRFNLNLNSHWKFFIETFNEGYQKFNRPLLDFANYRSIKKWTSIRLLISYGIILEDKVFDKLVMELHEKGVVKTMILGDDGKIAFIKVKKN